MVDQDNERIVKCMIVHGRYLNTIMVLLANDEIVDAFSYYPDELSFSSGEFIGKTLDGARDLYRERDRRYIQS